MDSTVHILMAHVSGMLKPDCIFHSIPLRAFKHGFVYEKESGHREDQKINVIHSICTIINHTDYCFVLRGAALARWSEQIANNVTRAFQC